MWTAFQRTSRLQTTAWTDNARGTMVGRRCQNSEYMVPRICLFLLTVRKACGFEMLYQETRIRKEGLRENGPEEVVSATLVEVILLS